jgi:hypothetical protein
MNPIVFAQRRLDRSCPLWISFDASGVGTTSVRRLMHTWRSRRQSLNCKGLRTSHTQKWTYRSMNCLPPLMFRVAFFGGGLPALEKMSVDVYSPSLIHVK